MTILMDLKCILLNKVGENVYVDFTLTKASVGVLHLYSSDAPLSGCGRFCHRLMQNVVFVRPCCCFESAHSETVIWFGTPKENPDSVYKG